MKDEFIALSDIPLNRGSTCPQPLEPPSYVHLDDPAISVMTDFKISYPVTTAADVCVDDALEHMKDSGVRLLLVTDDEQLIIGLITANDIQGERPIKVAQESRVPRSAISVGLIMTPPEDIRVLTFVRVTNARVGHVVETLNQLERQHILVVEVEEETKRHQVRGLFSMTQISKQLNRDVSHHFGAAQSLADIVHEIS